MTLTNSALSIEHFGGQSPAPEDIPEIGGGHSILLHQVLQELQRWQALHPAHDMFLLVIMNESGQGREIISLPIGEAFATDPGVKDACGRGVIRLVSDRSYREFFHQSQVVSACPPILARGGGDVGDILPFHFSLP